ARHLRLRPGRPPAVSPIPQTPLAIPGHTSVPGWTISAELVKKAGRFTFSDNPLEAHLDAEAVGASPLYVRSRLPGDRMRPLGLGGEKKLQDILVDAKVPVSERDAIPIIYNDNGIVWVVGLRVAQAAAITPRTREVLHLQAKPKASP
ncbi:MAG TPA: tRNA lysidine(34) synthetase TilS, partial [Dehalococcoidia bacterium]|nr:tRNA lysidine(34) synthetase TilS [Dehalococcoidia bacterium]